MSSIVTPGLPGVIFYAFSVEKFLSEKGMRNRICPAQIPLTSPATRKPREKGKPI
jgi:hypothetical protein